MLCGGAFISTRSSQGSYPAPFSELQLGKLYNRQQTPHFIPESLSGARQLNSQTQTRCGLVDPSRSVLNLLSVRRGRSS